MLAGIAGVLFANSVFVSPNMFSLQTNGQLIIWVIIGGLSTCAGPVMGCFLMLMLSTALGGWSQGSGFGFADPNLVMGILLTIFVIALPRGLLPVLSGGLDWLLRRLAPAARTTEIPAGFGKVDVQND